MITYNKNIVMISMTGYVKKDLKIEGNSYTIIIKSLNSTKGLDISIKTPRYFIDVENDIRKLIVNELIRGKIDFRLIENTNFSNLKFNSKKLDACIKSIRKIMPKGPCHLTPFQGPHAGTRNYSLRPAELKTALG